jgi:hypothetical protein
MMNESGYGMVRTNGRTKRRAHRVIWENYKGKSTPGMVLHRAARDKQPVREGTSSRLRTPTYRLEGRGYVGSVQKSRCCCPPYERLPTMGHKAYSKTT